MKKLGMYLVALLFSTQMSALFAQASERPIPWFTLSISEGQLPASYPSSVHEVQVKYTNVSDAVQWDNCVDRQWVYKIVVLRDGVPVAKRKSKSEDSDEPADPRRIRVPFTGSANCGRITQGIPPQRSVTFPLWVTTDYDMTEPGTYSITVKRQTFPGEPAKSVTVWSNTITIDVPSSVRTSSADDPSTP